MSGFLTISWLRSSAQCLIWPSLILKKIGQKYYQVIASKFPDFSWQVDFNNSLHIMDVISFEHQIPYRLMLTNFDHNFPRFEKYFNWSVVISWTICDGIFQIFCFFVEKDIFSLTPFLSTRKWNSKFHQVKKRCPYKALNLCQYLKRLFLLK